jgi:catechol 2,3-dioxygenase-like lactoylglutathione lyase family enzyme
MKFGSVTPVLRMFDVAKAREFYVDFLGFTVDFERRYEAGFPLYMGLSRGECRLHLSEHHGDGSSRRALPRLRGRHRGVS